MTLLSPAAERILAFNHLNDRYEAVLARGGDDRFIQSVLEEFDIRIEVDEDQLARIPREGPLVVVCNHPYGGLDGVILARLLRQVRPDARLLMNHLLRIMPEMDRVSFYVDPFDRPDAVRRNVAAMRAAVEFVRGGGALGIFPAGEVSHATWRRFHISDPSWSKAVGRLVRRTGAPVVPVFFDGRNSLVFNAAGLLNKRLRTVLLPRELLNKQNRTVRVAIGSSIPAARLAQIDSVESLTSYLRVRTYLLGQSLADMKGEGSARGIPAPRVEEIAPPADRDELQRELDALPSEQKLTSHGDLDVHYARARQVPTMIEELGRERERAFREVGEGTGRARDIDRFDSWYIHLVVWNRAQRELVGAYRFGPTDEILPVHGIDGLYTSTLFRFRRKLIDQIDPALEMGRSFVRVEYQREFAPLMLLWRAIGLFACRYPRYRYLFGPVSISSEYQSMSKKLLIAFLEQNRYLATLARLLRPRNPVRMKPVRDWAPREMSIAVGGIDEVERLIRELEVELRGVPILLRQYLKLNGKLLGFNVDPEFGNVIDGLILVDLTEVSRRVLMHYMGKDGAREFLAYHERQQSERR